MSFEEKIEVFLYLHNYPVGKPLRMDKTVHSCR